MSKIKKLPIEYFKSVAMLVVPLSIMAITILSLLRPDRADFWTYEDGIVETLSAIFLFAATIIFVYAFIVARKRNKSAKILIALAIFAIVSFVIGMEEISWGQRILEIESSKFFLENNRQQETNFHNLSTYTSLFETLYYTGAFIAFILLTFFSKHITKIFKKIKLLKDFNLFIPSIWLFVVFSSSMGLISSLNIGLLTIVPILSTIIFLIHKSSSFKDETKKFSILRTYSIVSLFTIIFCLMSFRYMSYPANVRTWYWSEYKEMYIALMIFIYSITIAYRCYLLPTLFKLNKKK